ncbi:hypothetical protein O7627_34690 [Solwaraspora sp. WMMD1047]|uniref:hypothetical protein n=1 Tax=Solwaraspora sp. WMMD1047 TaxID=3016102 RepID=UPI002417D622|nr:hypothetical protein [Solwaraspora sp. WMMD1047]MDG4834419.1 hypothetical protein [Solwaraspora sp. WMMD1047]
MLANKVFFSFTEVPDPADHHEYNAWHQLDHRPENLALPAVRWGERWVRSPDCAAAGPAPAPALRDLHYLNMYWFADPVEESLRDWQALAERSYQWGRRIDTRIARRLLMGTFTPVKGYVSPRVRVSADALPFRPNRGIAVTVTRLAEPHGPEAHDLFDWQDRVQIPHLLTRPTVAGVWTFASQSTTLDRAGAGPPGSTTFDEGAAEPGGYRVLLAYLDGDPLEHTAAVDAESGPEHPHPEESLMDGVLRAIQPWQWDWFE